MLETTTGTYYTGWGYMTLVLGWEPSAIAFAGFFLALVGLMLLISSYVLTEFANTLVMAKLVPIPLLIIGVLGFICGSVGVMLWAINALRFQTF